MKKQSTGSFREGEKKELTVLLELKEKQGLKNTTKLKKQLGYKECFGEYSFTKRACESCGLKKVCAERTVREVRRRKIEDEVLLRKGNEACPCLGQCTADG